jgi:hypothetical protein
MRSRTGAGGFAEVEARLSDQSESVLGHLLTSQGPIEFVCFVPLADILVAPGLAAFISLGEADTCFLCEAKQRKTEKECGKHEKQASPIGVF